MLISYHITLDKSKARFLEAFLLSMEGIEVEKHQAEDKDAVEPKRTKTPEFKYFGMCPDWEMDAAELRKRAWTRAKAQW